MLQGLKKRLNEVKGAWADELGSVLWPYRITDQSIIGETPFKLTYSVDAIIVVEVKKPSLQVIFRSISSQALQEEVNVANRAREIAHIRKRTLKHWITNRYNANIIPQRFQRGDLVLRHANIEPPPPEQGKLAANWEGPFNIVKVLEKGAYKLSTL